MQIATTDWEVSVLSTGPAFQAHSAKITPWNHWWRLPLSADFILCNLFKYLWNPSFIMALWLPLATTCTGISKVYWKVPLNISSNSPSSSTTIIFGIPNGTKKFPKAHRAAWYDLIYFIPMAAPISNPVIKSRHVSILQYPSWYRITPGTQKSSNTTSNVVSESIVWINCCVSWKHEFTNWQCSQALINWATSLLTIGHQKHASILNKVLCSWLWPANVDTWHADITTCMKLTGTTLSLSCLTLDFRGVP